MGNKIAGLYAEIGADTTKLQNGLTESKSKLGKFAGSLKDSVKELTGFNLASLTAAGAVVGAAKFVQASVNDWSRYAESVDKASLATGVGVEEMSRLIQTADDFRVSQEGLQTAMKMAMQSGFQPSIENLASLADELNAIKDPTDRAARAQEIFGRSWQEINPLFREGGNAIRDAAAGISSSLIVTEQAVERNRAYVEAVDGLNDSWTGFRNEIGQAVVPALTDLVEGLDNMFFATTRARDAALDNGDAALRSADTYAAYVAALHRGIDAERYQIDSLGRLLEKRIIQGRIAWEVVDANYALSESEYDLQKSIAASDDHMAKLAQQYNSTKGAASDYAAEVPNVKSAVDNLTLAFGPLTEQILYNQLAANMDKKAAVNLAVEMGLLDGKAYNLLVGMDELTKKYDANKDGVIRAAEQTEAYWKEVDHLRDSINNLQNKTVYVGVEVNWNSLGSDGLGGSNGLEQGRGGAQEGFATGVSNFVVPPGYPNDSFMVGLTSGEVVNVDPAGGQKGNDSKIEINLYNPNFAEPLEYEALLYRIVSDIRDRSRF